jgi:hypothetical protein
MMAVRKKSDATATAVPKVQAKTASKTASKRSKPVSAPAETILAAQNAADDAIETITVDALVAPATRLIETGADRAREAYARAQAASEQIRQTVAETATATTRGAVEINGKVLDAWRAQSTIAFDLWRQALTAGSVSEAIRVQTSGARQVYETAATHWKDVAETTNRWLDATVKPMRSALSSEPR